MGIYRWRGQCFSKNGRSCINRSFGREKVLAAGKSVVKANAHEKVGVFVKGW